MNDVEYKKYRHEVLEMVARRRFKEYLQNENSTSTSYYDDDLRIIFSDTKKGNIVYDVWLAKNWKYGGYKNPNIFVPESKKASMDMDKNIWFICVRRDFKAFIGLNQASLHPATLLGADNNGLFHVPFSKCHFREIANKKKKR